MYRLLLAFLIGFTITANAQELNCNVVVNTELSGNQNLPVFNTLQRQLREFVNNTKWTNRVYGPQEKIDCNFYINVTEYAGDAFKASIQIQSSRPIFGSTYYSPVYNFNDKDFTFRYVEFQNMIYNENQFESNLISVIAFHVYMVLGLDADTFELNGGDDFFKQAQTIVNYSAQEGAKGWRLEDGNQSRFMLIDNLMSPTFKEYRSVMYDYHRNGLDLMQESVMKAKTNIAEAVLEFVPMNSRRPNSFLLRTFFDAKSDEIEQIFTDGPKVDIADLVTALNRIAPTYSSKWRNIKF